MQKKTCTFCEQIFEITNIDIDFYKNIHVPLPTFCPDCRMQRRLSFRNERHLYKRKCDATNKSLISIYPPTTPHTIYDAKYWRSNSWNTEIYGREYDFSKPFFEQFHKLLLEVPRMALQNIGNENSDYCQDGMFMKNCYLCFNCIECEDCYHSHAIGWANNCLDVYWCVYCELCFECIKVENSYKAFFCKDSKNIQNCSFCEECQSCKNCFGCVGLRQKEYCILNKQYSKDEYNKKIEGFSYTYEHIERMKNKLDQLRKEVPHKHAFIDNSEDCIGNYISNSKNCYACFDTFGGAENSKYIWNGEATNSYDGYNVGGEKRGDTNFIYECIATYYVNNTQFCHQCSYCNDILYCDTCEHCENCFGCVGLQHKKYCILNKQYSKEEYFSLIKQLTDHMKQTKEFGEFFPSYISPIGYNDSVAKEYFSLSQEKKNTFNLDYYKKPEIYAKKHIDAQKLPENIRNVPDKILEWCILCENDNKPFKIIPQELAFYRKHHISLPKKCPDCRHFEKFERMLPRKIFQRKCARCNTEIQTSYSPDKPEQIYCEKCYLDEVY